MIIQKNVASVENSSNTHKEQVLCFMEQANHTKNGKQRAISIAQIVGKRLKGKEDDSN